ncbi:hypothetical protein [Leucobacter luti]|uniref:EcsC family protein n=1 Tax=Leucobacter luti TaxID=340320 RepID=A0A4Q7U4S8_9MICO|nr:hypothetical protein [Leucobacter luti]MBL3699610.1 hypothetical protein [Leucobacter luti]RZT67122.1 hypothetical protein EV139_1256 [Leucobacter luti]
MAHATGAPAAAASLIERAVDRVLSIQRPLVLAHLRRVGARNPDVGPLALTRALERRYIAAVTAGGSGVGAAAAFPGVGTVAALGIASAETVGFLEATALYAHSLAELHGITIRDPDRARILVLTLLLGDEGLSLLTQVTRQATGGASRTSFWGELVSSSLPRQLVGPLAGQLKDMFIRRAAKAGGASVVSKVLPYGIGAVLGGSGNYVMARRVVARSRTAFGPAPHAFTLELAELRAQTAAKPTVRERTRTRRAARSVERAGARAGRTDPSAHAVALGTDAAGGAHATAAGKTPPGP